MTDVTEKGSDFIKDLGDAARRNPISAALIGMGLVWLFAGGKSAAGRCDILQRTGLDRLPDAAKNTMNAAQDRLASAADAVRETGSDGIETATRMASEYAKSLPDSADVFGNVRGNLTDLFKAQPLALGAIGLAIGAGIAAALPATDIENSYLGETSETLKSKAAEIAGDQIEKASFACDRRRRNSCGGSAQGRAHDGWRQSGDERPFRQGRPGGRCGGKERVGKRAMNWKFGR